VDADVDLGRAVPIRARAQAVADHLLKPAHSGLSAGVAGTDKLRQRTADLLSYLEHNEAALVHYDARRRRGEPIATSFVESAVDEIIAWRMAKAQQMRWSQATVQPFLDVRTAVLNDTLEGAFRRRHPGFRPANNDQALPATA